MKSEYPYAPGRIPAPHPPITVGTPTNELTTPELWALVDSGADRTLVPESVVTQVQAEEVERLQFEVGSSGVITLPVYRVTLTVQGFAPVVADVAVSNGEENVLLGRDVLNLYTLTLDGPKQRPGVSDE